LTEKKDNNDVFNREDGFILEQKRETYSPSPGVHVIGAIGNSLAIETDLGFIQVDTGIGKKMATKILDNLKSISDAPVHTIIYSHGHNGYNNGARAFLETISERGEPRPQIVAHKLLPVRYRRYLETAKLQSYLNSIQFRTIWR